MKRKSVVVYHTDIDGHLSGAIIKRYGVLDSDAPIIIDGRLSGVVIKRHGGQGYDASIMVPMNYGEEFPWDLIDKNTDVWMADFSLQPWADMERLQKECARLVWIDHHKTSIDRYHEHVAHGGAQIEGLRVDGTAACRLCWCFCCGNTPEPRVVYLAGKYDVWEWQDTPGALEFNYGTKLHETDPGKEAGYEFLSALLESDKATSTVVAYGEVHMERTERKNAHYMKSASFETRLDGVRAIAANRGGNSMQFKSVWDPERHDIMISFHWANGLWNIGLYTEGGVVDVGELAKAHGGGGHRGAAGFQCKELPFELRKGKLE